MADILSQEEIDALLSATEGESRNPFFARLHKALRGLKLSKQESAKMLHSFIDAAHQISKLQKSQRAQAIETSVRGIITPILDSRSTPDAGRETVLAGVREAVDIRVQAERSVTDAQEQGKRASKAELEEVQAARIVTSYDFKHPARVNKDQLRTLENLHDNFARLLSHTFSSAMNAVVDVDTAFVDQTTYAEFIMSLSNPSSSYQFTLAPTSGQAILDIAMPLAFAMVDRACGGHGSAAGVKARQLTPAEMHIVNSVVKRVIEDLERTWEPVLQVEICDIELETNPEFMQITAASEIVILLAFEWNSTHASGLVSLCYPFFTLESILPRLGRRSYVRTTQQKHDEALAGNRLRLAQVPAPLTAELARGQCTLAEARQLQVGDILISETHADEPAVVFVGDEPKFLGSPCVSAHGARAVKVGGKIPAALETNYRNRSKPVRD
jgi:flagellar motor switch protein FliM